MFDHEFERHNIDPLFGGMVPEEDGVWVYIDIVEKILSDANQAKEAMLYAAMMLALVTSSDGSGHADLSRNTLVKAGFTPEAAKNIVAGWISDRTWVK